jgi:hypothetical protein
MWLTLGACLVSGLALLVSVWSLLFARFVERQLVEMARQLERFEQTWRR